MVNEASLLDLNDRLAKDRGAEDANMQSQCIDVQRFRPNLLIGGGLTPFCEDTWENLSVGNVDFQVAGLSAVPLHTLPCLGTS